MRVLRLLVLLFASAAPLAAAWGQAGPGRPGRAAQVAALLRALKAAPDAGAAELIERRVRLLWAGAGSPAAALLLARGERDLVDHDGRDAKAAFDAALVIDPSYAAAYAGRAEARFEGGDVGGAVGDIAAALQRDPSLFVVFDTLSRIAEARGDWRSALEAWRSYAAADPQGAGVQMRLRELTRKAEGEKS